MVLKPVAVRVTKAALMENLVAMVVGVAAKEDVTGAPKVKMVAC